jgi:hypothetical protein
MSSGHGNSRRQAYGRRMKDVRARRSTDLEVDLEGPSGWSRGSAWDREGQLDSTTNHDASSDARPR